MITDADSIEPAALPEFIDKTTEILNWLKDRSKEELKAIWKCNDKILEQNFYRLEKVIFIRCLLRLFYHMKELLFIVLCIIICLLSAYQSFFVPYILRQ